MFMTEKSTFKPFILYEKPTNEALYRIMALHTGYKASGRRDR
jgi:hypothetical protein